MRILIISDTTGYMRGGVPEATRQLINGLTAHDHIVGFCGDIPLPGVQGAEHFAIALPADERLAHDVQEAIRSFRPDVVHVISISSPGLFKLRRQLAALPWLMTCHSIPPYERKLAGLHGIEGAHYAARACRYFPHAMAWRWLLSVGSVPHVVAHSPWVQGLVVRYGQPAGATTLVPLGVEARGGDIAVSRAAGPRRPQLVTVGGIAHTKGLHDAVRAVAVLRRRHANLRYQIIGEVRDGSYLRFLRALIQELRLEDVVFITPDLPGDEKDAALRAADVYVQPSHEEGFCLAYIEAARIVPRLVGTATGAIGLISDGDALARVVPPRNSLDLAAAIDSVLGTELPPDLMQRRQGRLASRFGWSGYVSSHEALYQSLREQRSAADSKPQGNGA